MDATGHDEFLPEAGFGVAINGRRDHACNYPEDSYGCAARIPMDEGHARGSRAD